MDEGKQEAGSPEVKEDKTKSTELNMIEQAEAEKERLARLDPTTLLSDAAHCIRMERERIERRTGDEYHSAYEAYSVLLKALEDKTTAEKDLKKTVESLWTGVKAENEDTIIAFLGEIERVARESAMAWVHIAAICQKAEASL